MNRLERIDHPIKQLPNGDWLTITLFRIEGTTPGPHVHVQANVHGAELQGNAVIFKMLEWFTQNPFKGSITFIPMANPIGSNTKVGTYTYGRFNSITGDNWNRAYEDLFSKGKELTGKDLSQFVKEHLDAPWENIKKSYKAFLYESFKNLSSNLLKYGPNENKLTFITLQKIACTADIVLDLHTGPVAVRYIYSASYQKNDVKNFHFPFVINIPNEFAKAMDEATFINWIRLQDEFKKQGKEIPLEFNSFTLELGGEEILDLESAQTDMIRILHYLKSKGIVETIPELEKKSPQYHGELSNYKTYYAPVGGQVHFCKTAGDKIETGEVLAKILNFRPLKSAHNLKECLIEVVARNPGHIINHCPSSNVGQGAELFQVMEFTELLDNNS